MGGVKKDKRVKTSKPLRIELSKNTKAEKKKKGGSTKIVRHSTPKVVVPISKREAPKENSTENFLALQSLLNTKLSETVRQNMDYPALQNRTGRFASSVRITDIVQTKKGYPSIGYTYEKNPYQIFELGKGKVPWANEHRDPRALIDRSIREIAAEYIKGRFYTRRV